MITMKYLIPALFLTIVLTVCFDGKSDYSENFPRTGIPAPARQANMLNTGQLFDLEADYQKVNDILADISAQIHQPNILKTDVLRGWYLGARTDKKYGTPDTWIFVENGENSKWISPHLLDEEPLADDRSLCKKTAGTYYASCLQTSDQDCEYVGESYCQCPAETKWKESQGCILVTERGSYVAINNRELEQGWYFGFSNEKKLNTPVDWVWIETGRKSVWQKPQLNLIF